VLEGEADTASPDLMPDAAQNRGNKGARVLGMLLTLCVGAFLGGVICTTSHRFFPKLTLPCCPQPVAQDEVLHCAVGPWGDLNYVMITLEIPKVWTSIEAYTGTPIKWFFGNMTPAQVVDVCQSAGLGAADIQSLLASAEASTQPKGTTVSPPDDLILGLDQRARSYIYSVLSNYPENTDYRDPHRYLSVNFNRWLGESPLPAKTLSILRQLAYQRGRITLFSDVRLALASLDSFTDKQKLLQLLSRQTTLMPVLHVAPDSDTEGLAKYWGRGGREAEVGALMDSVKRSREGGTIDILYLLPPFVRERVYTYPRKTVGPFPDCHYTSINFFNAVPDERFTDVQRVRETVMKQYRMVESGFQLGDLIILRNSSSDVVHSCNYVADDIVFTKNGSSRGRPWVLMHLQDVIDMYSTRGPVDMRVLRRDE
jgi:hypothetical protein